MELRRAGALVSSQLFSPGDARALHERAAELEGWQPARVISPDGSSKTDPRDRRADVIRLGPGVGDLAERSGLAAWLERMTAAVLELDAAGPRLGASALQDVQLVRYRTGGFYGWHCDTNDRGFRRLSALCYVNDDFEGGETCFASAPLQPLLRRPRVRQLLGRPALADVVPSGRILRPRAGQLVAFDALTAHRARPVRRGTKLVFALFLA